MTDDIKPEVWRRMTLDELPLGAHIRMLDGTPDGHRFATYVKQDEGLWYTVRVYGGHVERQENLIGAYEVLGGLGLAPE